MPTAPKTFIFKRNADKVIRFRVFSAPGVGRNCSSWTVTSDVKLFASDAEPIGEFTVDDTDAATGVFFLTMPLATIAAWPAERNCVFDVKRVDGGNTDIIVTGHGRIVDGVT